MAKIKGTALRDILTGTAAADQIFGLAGKDDLYGGAGNDKLYGGLGNDKLYGGAGDDGISVFGQVTAFGGDGNDTIELAGNSGETENAYGGARIRQRRAAKHHCRREAGRPQNPPNQCHTNLLLGQI